MSDLSAAAAAKLVEFCDLWNFRVIEDEGMRVVEEEDFEGFEACVESERANSGECWEGLRRIAKEEGLLVGLLLDERFPKTGAMRVMDEAWTAYMLYWWDPESKVERCDFVGGDGTTALIPASEHKLGRRGSASGLPACRGLVSWTAWALCRSLSTARTTYRSNSMTITEFMNGTTTARRLLDRSIPMSEKHRATCSGKSGMALKKLGIL